MRLTVLGSGSCELIRERSSPAYLLEAGGQGLMLDLGQGAWRRLLETGRQPHELSAVLLSHHHPDHLGDLLPLLFALNYDPLLRARARLTLVAHPDLQRVLEALGAAFGHWIEPGPERLARLWLQPGQGASLGDVRLATAASPHLDSSLAFRLEHQGVSLVYLGDGEASPGLAELARGADLLLAHCAGSDQDPKPGHLYPSAAGRLARQAGVKALLLSHFYREVDPGEAVAGAAALFAGPVWAARDLLTVELAPGQPPRLREA